MSNNPLLHTQKTKDKIRAALKGVKKPKATRDKMSKARRAYLRRVQNEEASDEQA